MVEILTIERSNAVHGLDSLPAVQACTENVTAVATYAIGGFTYEARKCVPRDSRGTERFEGKWLIEISGLMNGTGSADISTGGG